VADFLSRYSHNDEDDFCEQENDPSGDKDEVRVNCTDHCPKQTDVCSIQSRFHGTLLEREVSINYNRKSKVFPFQVDIRPVETRRQARKRQECET